jgi:hypothetical protein
MRVMNYGILSAVLIATLATSVLAEAREWKRQGTATTPRGTYSSQGSGSCANGACAWGGATTGPNGRTTSHTGSAVRTDDGASATRQYTGPNGGTTTTTKSVTQTESGYDWSKQTTGPNGNAVSRSGSITVTPSN